MSDLLRQAQNLPFIFRFQGARLSAFFLFPINPEKFALTLPSRGSVIQTMSSNFENWFGAGVPKGHLSGTFGFRARPQIGLGGAPLPGQVQSRFLETLVTSFYNEAQETIRREDGAVQFWDISDVHFLKIRLLDFQYERSTSHQFLYRFDIHFVVLRDYLNPAELLPENSLLSKLASPAELLGDLIEDAGDFLGLQTGSIPTSIGVATEAFKRVILGEDSGHGSAP